MFKKIFPFLIIIVLFAISLMYYQKKGLPINNLPKPTDVEITGSSNSAIPTTAPMEKIFLQVNEPKNNITVSNPIVNISGKTIPNAYIFINEQELKADANGRFESATTLDEGENYILIVASDDLGNSVEKDILVNLETMQ